MKYIDGFRNSAASAHLAADLRRGADRIPAGRRPVRLMEVCGTHTMAIGRHGIRDILPPAVDLLSGPGCPVCVTEPGYIDAAITLATEGVDVCTFGDLVRVPGSRETLAEARAAGACVTVCYSPAEAIERAALAPDRPVVFLAVGFETTAPVVAAVLDDAVHRGLRNFSLLVAFRRVLPALDALAADPGMKIDGFLCPAHVSAIIGSEAYEPFAARSGRPCVIAGFEPVDILMGVTKLVELVTAGRCDVINLYERVVRRGGNAAARAMLDRYFEPAGARWRGLGAIPDSGHRLRAEWRTWDAEERFGVRVGPGESRPGCRCGEVIKGCLKPPECPLFGTACTPLSPVGPCMVSSEGTCAAYYKYSRLAAG